MMFIANWALFPTWAKRAIMGAGAAVLALIVWALWLLAHDHRVLAKEDMKTIQYVAPAKDAAADQRAKDTVALDQKDKQTHDAIAQSGPDRAAAPSTIALGCQRLRGSGRAESSLPAVCRLGGGH
jgi:hypothetical protein